jgi:hypothetical protein
MWLSASLACSLKEDCTQVLDSISIPVKLDDRASLLEASNTYALLTRSLSVRNNSVRQKTNASRDAGGEADPDGALPCRSLSSKVVSQYSSLLSPMAVESVLAVLDPARPNTCASLRPHRHRLSGLTSGSNTVSQP